MPSSYVGNIPPIMRVLETARPRSVLEIGPGWGKYGVLLRERVDQYEWKMEIVGVEIWEDYIRQSRVKAYDEFFFGDWLSDSLDLREILSHYGPFDFCLMIDVLEHFTFEDGVKALDKAFEFCQQVLISTPIGYVQGPAYGNPHEAHLSEWPEEAIAAYVSKRDYEVLFVEGGTPDSVIAWVQKP